MVDKNKVSMHRPRCGDFKNLCIENFQYSVESCENKIYSHDYCVGKKEPSGGFPGVSGNPFRFYTPHDSNTNSIVLDYNFGKKIKIL